MNFLESALAKIDNNLQAHAGEVSVLAQGLAQQVFDKEGRPMPIRLTNGGEPSGPNDKYDWTFYHRNEGVSVADSDYQYGSKLTQKESYRMILVAFVKRLKISSGFTEDYEIAQKIKFALNNENLEIKTAKKSKSKVTEFVVSAADIQSAELADPRNIRYSAFIYILMNYEITLEFDPFCFPICKPIKPIC